MVMTSSQISQMAMAQMGMFASNQSYAQQITPPGGYMPGMGPGMMGGYGSGRPPQYAPGGPPSPGWAPPMYGGMPSMAMSMPFAAPQAGFPQAMGVQMAGGIANGAQSMFGGLQAMSGMAGLAAGGMSLLGMGGGLATGLAAAGSMPVTMGLAAGAYGAQQLGAGVQERRMMNNVLQRNFAGRMGIGEGVQGFNNQEMGQISTMVRGMTSNDMFTSYDELTRVMDRTAQMGLYKGAGSVEQFSTKFKQLVGTLKQVAQTLGTTLEGATQMVEQSRGMGFFSGQDVTASLGRAQGLAGISGMSMPTMMQLGQQGSQIGRMMGMRGKTGAGAMQNMAANYMLAMQTGALSSEDVYNATGLTGEEGAAALASRSMDVNSRFLKRGAGRVMNAAFWNKDGGVDTALVRRAMSGDVSFRELQGMARGNIRATGGQGSEFFRDEARIAGQVQEAGGGDLMIGMLAQHVAGKRGLDINDPRVTRFLQRQTGQDLGEIEAKVKMFQKMPSLMLEKGIRAQQLGEEQDAARQSEGGGFEGVRRKYSHWWEQNVDNKIKQEADNFITALTSVFEKVGDEITGTIRTRVDASARQILDNFSKTGTGLRSQGEVQASLRSMGVDTSGGTGELGALGRLGVMAGVRSPGVKANLARMHMSTKGTGRELEDRYNRAVSGLTSSMDSMGLSDERVGAFGLDATKMIMDVAATTPQWMGNLEHFKRTGNAVGAAMMGVTLLKNNSPEARELFAAAKGDQQKEIAIYEKMVGSRFKGTAFDSGVSRALGQAGGATQADLEAISSEIDKQLSGVSKTTKYFGGLLAKVEVDSPGLTQFRGNATVMKALTGMANATDDATRRAANTELVALAEKETDPANRKALLVAANQLMDKDSALSKRMQRVSELELDQASTVANKRYLDMGARLKEQSRANKDQLSGIMEKNPEMKKSYDDLVSLWSTAGKSPVEIHAAIQEFTRSYAGSKEGANLAALLQDKQGAMGYLGFAMGEGRVDINNLTKYRGGRATEFLLQKQLGIDEEAMRRTFGTERETLSLFKRLEGGGKGHDAAIKEIMGKLSASGTLTSENKGILERQLGMARDRYSQEEASTIGAQGGAGEMSGRLLSGAGVPTTARQMSPSELMSKQVEHLSKMVDSNKKQEVLLATIAQKSDTTGIASAIIAAAGNKGGSGVDEGAGGGTTPVVPNTSSPWSY